MKLLIITQKMAKNDPILGFFHRWLEEFAKNFEKVTVICLEKGEFNLPTVKVLSLGKESGESKIKYLWNFYKYIWHERKNYDAVFVHMNQEYVLLGWKFWKLWGKKIYLWRNHAKGNIFTDLAVLLSHKVFCTSPSSYTARFKKTTLMPVGVDTDFFKPNPSVPKIPNSVLFLGRITPVKRVLEFINWVKGTQYQATIAGPVLSEDREYGEQVKRNLTDKIKFIGPVTREEALKLYQTHELYVNKTPAGSFDKTIFEAVACGMKLMVDNPDAQNVNVEGHSLKRLMQGLTEEIR
ncbi:MAG: glycosyltransferase family 4 protein [Candidatus Zambryskibacteria bacterium]|nr:glycosyltransferase family 4 protein [Candidatus Zambryskibacteria bacterium]